MDVCFWVETLYLSTWTRRARGSGVVGCAPWFRAGFIRRSLAATYKVRASAILRCWGEPC